MSTDAFDLTTAIVASGDCPAVSGFPIISTMAEINLSNAEQGYAMNFAGRDTWPGVVPPDWTGPINHTLWLCERIGGVWYILPVKEALGDYCTLGPILTPGQVPNNLTYYAGAPMAGYQPQPYEQVGFFATTGDTRRMNLQAGSPGRTNVMLVPFAAGHYISSEPAPGPDPIPPSPSGTTLDDVMEALAQLGVDQSNNTTAIQAHTTSEIDRVMDRLADYRSEVIDFANLLGKALLLLHHRRKPDDPAAPEA